MGAAEKWSWLHWNSSEAVAQLFYSGQVQWFMLPMPTVVVSVIFTGSLRVVGVNRAMWSI